MINIILDYKLYLFNVMVKKGFGLFSFFFSDLVLLIFDIMFNSRYIC